MDSPRDLVRRALRFEFPSRLPRQTWVLPMALRDWPEEFRRLEEEYPSDICGAPVVDGPCSRRVGNRHDAGQHIDEWGCRFVNIQQGVIGEVRDPILVTPGDCEAYRPPEDVLPSDPAAAREAVNRFCGETDRHVHASCCPQPWERFQFLRGSEQAMIDLLEPDEPAFPLLRRIHEFYLRQLEFWVTTDVDGIMISDDWGAQHSLLISPDLWREVFKPLYRDYCEIAHAHGKFAFMHSDGCISAIYRDLVEVGVDAINSQLGTMDLADLERRVKGRITFWGEIDRQHVLPGPDPSEARGAVREIASHLYDPAGGIIAQFEFGAGINPANAFAIHEEWEQVHRESLERTP